MADGRAEKLDHDPRATPGPGSGGLFSPPQPGAENQPVPAVCSAELIEQHLGAASIAATQQQILSGIACLPAGQSEATPLAAMIAHQMSVHYQTSTLLQQAQRGSLHAAAAAAASMSHICSVVTSGQPSDGRGVSSTNKLADPEQAANEAAAIVAAAVSSPQFQTVCGSGLKQSRAFLAGLKALHAQVTLSRTVTAASESPLLQVPLGLPPVSAAATPGAGKNSRPKGRPSRPAEAPAKVSARDANPEPDRAIQQAAGTVWLPFASEDDCRRHFVAWRASRQPACQRCGSRQPPHQLACREVLECCDCRYQTGLRSGTPLANSNLSYLVWFTAIRLLAIDPACPLQQLRRQLLVSKNAARRLRKVILQQLATPGTQRDFCEMAGCRTALLTPGDKEWFGPEKADLRELQAAQPRPEDRPATAGLTVRQPEDANPPAHGPATELLHKDGQDG